MVSEENNSPGSGNVVDVELAPRTFIVLDGNFVRGFRAFGPISDPDLATIALACAGSEAKLLELEDHNVLMPATPTEEPSADDAGTVSEPTGTEEAGTEGGSNAGDATGSDVAPADRPASGDGGSEATPGTTDGPASPAGS